ncbi:MAG: ABA4-like family protein [Myxococcota bacterium]
MTPPQLELAFALANASVMPWWAVFVVAPRSRAAARLASHGAVFAALGALYAGLVVAAFGAGPAGPSTASPLAAASWRAVLGTDSGFLAGWVHYLCFDLFVGAWIVREARRIDVAPRVELLFAWLLGPLGLLLFLARRARRLRSFGGLGEIDAA